MKMHEVLAAAADIAASDSFYVEARVGSANHRNRGNGEDPCRAVWKDGGKNEPADVLIRSLAAAVVALSGPMGIDFQTA